MRVGAYEVQGELGRGGFAVVYEARSPRGERVAVKLLRSRDPDDAARFEREAALQGQLGLEDGFVPLLDRGVAPEGPFTVMPFLEGGTLKQRLARGPLPVAEAIGLVRALAGAMARAHGRGILHRDLKPDNVLLDARGMPFIADLGLGKLASSAQALTRTGEFFGTVGYMAPEQVDGSRDVKPAADVFSLGVIAFECLAGQTPFAASSLIAYAESVRSGPPALRSIREDVPAWLERVVSHALDQDPKRRPADGAALLSALAPPRSSRLPMALAGLALVVALGAGAALAQAKLGASDPRSSASDPTAPPSVANQGTAGPGLRDPIELEIEKDAELGKKNPPAARSALHALAVKHQGLASIWSALCALEIRDRHPLEARAAADHVVELERGSARSLVLRAGAEGNLHAYRAELEDATLALRLDPENADAFALRAQAWEARGKRGEGISDARAALERAPGNALADFFLVKMLADREKQSEALAVAEKGVLAAPGEALTWFARAFARQSLWDVAGARADTAKGLALVPDSAEASLLEVLIDALDQNPEAAAKAAKEAVERDQWRPRCWQEALRVAPKEWKKDLRDQRRRFQLQHPELEDFLEPIIQDMLGEPESDRLALLNEVLARAPGNEVALMLRGDIVRRRDLEGALADLDAATRIHPLDIRASLVRAEILEAKGDEAAARSEAEHGLSISPQGNDSWQFERILGRGGTPPK